MSRIPARDMADEFDKLVYGKDMWLQAHGPTNGDCRGRRPTHEVEVKLLERKVLLQAAADYRAHAERQAAAK